jgi:hypothetical protein
MKSSKKIGSEISLEQVVVWVLIDDKSYPKDSLIFEYNVDNTYHTSDIVIIDTWRRTLLAAIELKWGISCFSDLEKATKIRKEQEKKIFTWKYPQLKVFIVVHIIDEDEVKLLTLNFDDGKGQESLGYKSLEEFPKYEELLKSVEVGTKQNEITETGHNYKNFKRFSWWLWVLSLFLFLFPITYCRFVLVFRWHYKKVCELNIWYPQLILFGIAIVLILIPFLRKVKTSRFELDWDNEDKK